MAVQSPLAPGLRTTVLAPFSPYSDSPLPLSAAASRPDSALLDRGLLSPSSNTASNQQSNLAAPSPIAPSPIYSETTEFADVDEVEEQVADPIPAKPQSPASKSSTTKSPALKVDTSKIVFSGKPVRSDEDEPPASVIYAPAGFGEFHSSPEHDGGTVQSTKHGEQPKLGNRTDSTESISSDITVTRIKNDRAGKFYDNQMPPTPLQTSIPTAPDWVRTPRAQTRQDLGFFSRPSSSLASITEGDDYMSDLPSTDEDGEDSADSASVFFRNAEDEVKALHQALTECWTLCNTLASLSNIHRERNFTFSGKGTMQQQAWKSCWKLCQNLYEARNDTQPADARTTLEDCRDFCQALFDVRVRDNETADSVLRVSFELNNHLFNTHDRYLPEAFRERTLDFYITLCHRLMKQKARMAEEPDNLLKACWSLAEMLFSLRQSKREGKQPDEEMLGSAIQACWDLCDLFREGWSSVRPDSRQTPRPSQTTFTQAFQQARQAGMTFIDENGNLKLHPETPTTMIDESTTESPCEAPPPNIVVLGSKESNATAHSAMTAQTASQTTGPSRQTAYKWPTSHPLTGSAVVDVRSSSRSSSVTTKPSEDQALVLLKSLFVRAALLTNRGFIPVVSTVTNTTTRPQPAQLTSLPLFAKSLPETAFGAQAWQMNLLDNYRRAVVNDNTFRDLGAATDARLILPTATDPTTSVRLRKEVASAVKGMVAATRGWTWLKDLFRLTFGVYIEEVFDEEASPKRAQSRANSAEPSDRNASSASVNKARQDQPGKIYRSNSDEKLTGSDDSSLSRSASRSSSRGGGGNVTSNSGEKRSTSVPMQRS